MAEPNDAVVLKRAKAAAEQDGFTWEFGMPGAFGAPLRRQHFLSTEGQQEYLDRARADLHNEPSNA